MRFHTTNFIRRIVKVTVVAICLTAGLATGQSAYAIDVTQNGDTLTITGDNSDDAVYIQGLEGFGGPVGTWTSLGIDTYYGVQNIHVDLQGGDNLLWMYDLWFAGDVTFAAGDGNDQVTMNQSNVNNVTFELGGGDNDVHFEFNMLGPVSVSGGSGCDRVEMLHVDCEAITCITRGGDDFVGIGGGYSTWDTGFGDVSENITVRTGSGRDLVALVGVNALYGDTLIRLGRQDDILAMAFGGDPNEFFGEFTARGGGGYDTLYRYPENVYYNTPTFQSFEEEH